jgi:hypothetical protein
MVPVLGAVASELLWTIKIASERKREGESGAMPEDCRDSPPLTTNAGHKATGRYLARQVKILCLGVATSPQLHV